MFPQEHRPGEYGQSDFTSMNALGVTIGGRAVRSSVLPLRAAVLELGDGEGLFLGELRGAGVGISGGGVGAGRVPKNHRTDNLSAATHDLAGGGREFNERYLAVLRHYGVQADRNTPGRAHENGDVEQGHHRFKRAVEQALLLRGSREFESRGEYEGFLRQVLAGRNRPRLAKLSQELARMRGLPLRDSRSTGQSGCE